MGAVTDSNATPNTVAENAAVGTPVGLTGLATDADATNNTITYSLDDTAGGRFAIDSNTGVVTVNAALDYETATSHAVTVRATSSDGSFSTQSFTIAVTDVNDNAPVAAGDQYTMTQADTLVVAIPGLLGNDRDNDGDVLTAVLATNVSHGSLVLRPDGSFTYVPPATFFGMDQFSYFVSDGNWRSDVVTVTIVVEAVAPSDGGDDGTDPDPPPDEDPDDKDIPPDESTPPPVDEGLPVVGPPRDNGVGRSEAEASPLGARQPDDLPSWETRADRVSGTAPWLLDTFLRPSTALRMTEAATARTEGEVADERKSVRFGRAPDRGSCARAPRSVQGDGRAEF